MALCHCNIRVELREVRLADKPKEMLAASEKGTVPILVLKNKTVLDTKRICRSFHKVISLLLLADVSNFVNLMSVQCKCD